jgi:hypothetical protein
MKVSTEGLATAESIAEPVKDGGTRGLKYETIADWTGINQLAQLDAEHAVVVRSGADKAVNLQVLPLP